MKIETYEKKIAYLEEQIESLKEQLKMSEESTNKKLLKTLGSREKLFKDLLTFLHNLYERHGSIQNDLMKHMGVVSDQLNGTTKTKMSVTLGELGKLMGLPAIETKTSGGLFLPEETDAN